MQYAKYFANKMKLSQGYNDGNHKRHTTCSQKDYPIDETYGSSGKGGEFLAPFDCKLVKKYAATSNHIWLTSTDKVRTPSGEKIVTLFVVHITDDEFNNLKVGDIFKQGEKIVSEGIDGNATGYHNHVCVGFGEISGTGWTKQVVNGSEFWVLTTKEGTQKPEDVFYVDKSITEIVDSKGIEFKEMPAEEETKEEGYKTGIYKVLENLYIRKTAGTNEHALVKDCTNAMKKALTSTDPNAYASVKAGRNITALEIIEKDNGSVWVRNYSGYLCLKGVSGQIYLEFVE